MLRFRYMDSSGKTIETGEVEVPMDNAIEIIRVLVFPFRAEIATAEIRNMPGDAIWFRRLHNTNV